MLRPLPSSQPKGAPLSVWCVLPSRWKPLSCCKVQKNDTEPVESDPGEPMIVELRCSTTGHMRTQTKAVHASSTSDVSIATERMRDQVRAGTRRTAALSAGALDPTASS